MSEIRELYRSDSTVLGSCNNLLFVFGLQVPVQRDFETLVRIGCQAMPKQWPSGLALLLCARAGVRPPDKEQRERVTAVLKQLGPNLRAMAFVVHGQGFLPAAARSVFAGASLALRSDYPIKVFSDTPAGIAWLVSKMAGQDGARFDQVTLVESANSIVNASIPPSASAP